MSHVVHLRLDGRGRLVLPSDVRRRLGVEPGDAVSLREESDGSLRIESRRAAARALIGLAGTARESVVDELIADRRAQSAIEDDTSVRRARSLSHPPR